MVFITKLIWKTLEMSRVCLKIISNTKQKTKVRPGLSNAE